MRKPYVLWIADERKALRAGCLRLGVPKPEVVLRLVFAPGNCCRSSAWKVKSILTSMEEVKEAVIVVNANTMCHPCRPKMKGKKHLTEEEAEAMYEAKGAKKAKEWIESGFGGFKEVIYC